MHIPGRRQGAHYSCADDPQRSDRSNGTIGVTPSFFSAHTFYWGDRHASIFMGPERAANMSPARWALDAGVRFSSHLDTPVTPMLPLQAVWSQVERKAPPAR